MSTETEERAGKTRKIVLLQFVAMVKSGTDRSLCEQSFLMSGLIMQ